MKKPLKEVMEKASNRANNTPFEVRKSMGYGYDVWGGDGCFICHCDNEPEANSIAHCLNNFGPLLEALKYVIDEIDDDSLLIGLATTIKAASEVEVSG